MLRLDVRPERKLVRLGRPERDVTAFTRHRHPEPARLDQRADAEPGARADAPPWRPTAAAPPPIETRSSRPSAVSASASASKSLRSIDVFDVRAASITSRGRITQWALVSGTASPVIGPARSMIAERGLSADAGRPTPRSRLRCWENQPSPPTGIPRAAHRGRGPARSGHLCRRYPRSRTGKGIWSGAAGVAMRRLRDRCLSQSK